MEPFQVPWIPKNKDSVRDGYTKPHFRPKPRKTRFYTDFVIVLQTIWHHVTGPLAHPWGSRAPVFRFFPHRFSISFFMDFGLPAGPPKKGRRHQDYYLWGWGKTSHSEKSMANTPAERHSSKIAQTGAVKERKLLRGKVSQGRPHPLRLRFKCEGQTLNKNK